MSPLLRRDRRFSSLHDRFKRRTASVLAALLAASAFAVLPAPPAAAHGNFDQGPTVPNASSWCSTQNFSGNVLTTEDLRQSFKPSVGTLVAADFCLNVTGGQPATFAIQRQNPDGTFTDVATRSELLIGVGLQTLHIDFSDADSFTNALQLTPNATYFLTLKRTQVAIQWLTTCGSALAPCSPAAADRYPNGSTNFAEQIGANADFGFRTWAGDLPNLTGSVTSIGGGGVACTGQTRTLKAQISNIGSGTAAAHMAKFVLSSDNVIEGSDPQIGIVDVPQLAEGESAEVTLTDGVLPALAEGRAFVGVIADSASAVTEANENDNTGNAGIAIFCGKASISGLSIANDRTSIPAGSYRLPLSSIDPALIGFSATGTESAPVYPFAVSSTPVYPFPVYPFPVYPFPVYPFFQGVSDSALADLSLAEIPITGGWVNKVKDTIYETTPLQNISFKQYLDLKPCESNPQPCNPNTVVTLGDIDFGHSPMRRATLATVALAGVPLRDVSLTGPAGQDWCLFLGGQGFNCGPSYGIDPNTTSLLGLTMAGATPTIPWSTMPFKDMKIGKSPLYAVELRGYAIGQTPLRLVPVSAVARPSDFVTCTSCSTFGDAAEQGAVKAGVYFGQLIDALTDKAATLGSTTLGDYLLGILPDRNTWPTSSLALNQAALFAGTGQVVTSTISLTAATGANTAPVVDPQITAALPPGFLVKPGTSKVIYPANTAARSIADPAAAGGGMRWNISEIVQQGTTLKLQYQTVSSLDLQIAGTTISAHAVDQFGSVDSGPLANQAPVEVVDTETIGGLANEDPATAPVLERGVRRLGHISRADDVDLYRIPVPKGSSCDIADSAGAAGAGCRIRVTLDLSSNVPAADFDMVLYGPNVDPTTQASPVYPFPVYPFTSQENTTTAGTENAQPETLQDAPVYPFPVYTFSSVRGSSEEFVEGTVVNGQTGYFTVAVYGYNGDTTPHSYVLGVSTSPPAPLGPCPARTFPYAGIAGAAPSVPSTTSTLILWNQERTGAQYGPDAATTLGSNLATFAARSDVNGVVYPIESDPEVDAAYADWDASPCDVAKANVTVAKISALIASLKANLTSFKYVVLVGSDELIPYGRVVDNTPSANERDYVSSLQQITLPNNNALLSAAANGFFWTDDAYATDEPFDSAGHPIFVPKWSVGRLVETPQQITNQLTAFSNSGGVTDAPPDQTAFLAGYDFASDGTEESAVPLRARLGSSNVATLNCDTWSKQDLIDNIVGPAPATPDECLSPIPAPTSPPDIVEINGHADNFRLLPAIGNLNHNETDLLKPAELPLIPGRVVFSVGCHFGLNVANTLVASPTAEQQEQLGDWAEKLAGESSAVVLANTGYGYGDSVAVALSERLTATFSEGLDGTQSVGEALIAAKQDYWLNHMGAYGAYDEKALQEAVLYGLPMFTVPGEAGAGASASAAVEEIQPLSTDPAGTGLLVRSFDSGTISFDEVVTDRGTIVSVGGNALIVNRHPIVPQVEFEATNTDPANPSHKSIGFVMTGSTGTVVSNFDPVFARAEFDSTHAEPQSVGAWPTAPGVVNGFGPTQKLILWPGRFSPPLDFAGKPVTGDFIKRSRMLGTLYYSTQTGPRPRILEVHAAFVDAAQTRLSFNVRTSGEGSTVKRVAILAGSAFGDLSPNGTNRWSGTLTVPAGIDLSNVLVQAVSPFGVGYWANKGTPLLPTIGGQNGLTIDAGCTPTNGWCRADTVATVTVDDSSAVPIEVSLDGKAYEAYNPLTGVSVTGTGIHVLRARGYDAAREDTLSATSIIAIDKEGPTITIGSPDGNATYPLNSTVTPQFACGDAGSGVSTCSGPATVDTSTPGTHSYTVTASDVATNESTKTVEYEVAPDTVAPTITITRPVDGATYTAGSTVTASYSCADTGGSGLASCNGSVPNGAPIDTSVGPHTFTVTATDNAGNTSVESVSYNVPGDTFQGFFSPVQNPPDVNTTQAGNTTPFKFRVFDADGVERTSTAGFSFFWRMANCSTWQETSQTNLNAGSNPSFRYDSGSKMYIFNATSVKSWAGQCRRFYVKLPDGTLRFAFIKFVK